MQKVHYLLFYLKEFDIDSNSAINFIVRIIIFLLCHSMFLLII